MEKKTKQNIVESKIFNEALIPNAVKILIGGLAYGLTTDTSLEYLLDEESHHEFQNNITILSEFIAWFKRPEVKVLRTRDHVTILRYLISLYMRAYHRNLKHKIVLKLSSTGEVVAIMQ